MLNHSKTERGEPGAHRDGRCGNFAPKLQLDCSAGRAGLDDPAA